MLSDPRAQIREETQEKKNTQEKNAALNQE